MIYKGTKRHEEEANGRPVTLDRLTVSVSIAKKMSCPRRADIYTVNLAVPWSRKLMYSGIIYKLIIISPRVSCLIAENLRCNWQIGCQLDARERLTYCTAVSLLQLYRNIGT